MRTQAILVCTECGEENYHTSRNKKVQLERMEVTKYCPRERKHTLHKEKN
ncbi:50S ribosomal protein L33 [Erysipelothrix rhusiopathiae SY1027]|nr:50S ribosomal protein L33 [Erysipelothrix rhusiopathiae]AGN24167.1 50S ribosomal protein L33 [Erysipelothrix rhusiopathiae SY1027]